MGNTTPTGLSARSGVDEALALHPGGSQAFPARERQRQGQFPLVPMRLGLPQDRKSDSIGKSRCNPSKHSG